MINDSAKVRIRMYRQGLGDCFLLTFFKAGKEKEDVHILIDCGTLGHGKKDPSAGMAEAAEHEDQEIEMIDVINDIAKEIGKHPLETQPPMSHLHLLVITHEHKDHVSGFNKTGQKVFDNVQVDNVWLAWTEDRTDELAQSLAQHKKDLLQKSLNMVRTLAQFPTATEEEKNAFLGMASSTRQLLTFSGEEEGDFMAADDFKEMVDAAMDYASTRARTGPTFLWSENARRGKPEKGPIIEPDFLPGWRFYVLGPPYSKEKINRLGDRNSEELYHVTERLTADLTTNLGFLESNMLPAEYRNCPPLKDDLAARQRFEASFPFDACFRIEKVAKEKENRATHKRLASQYEAESWRRIDFEWLNSVGDLALQLDNSTNNASLVLAIEECRDDGEIGRVLLFPGDAQLGNWETWDGSLEEPGPLEFSVRRNDPTTGKPTTAKVTSKDLLERTVFYKVGHHSSYNATTIAGLEIMNEKASQMLVAMIPVDSNRATGIGWTMPEPKLYGALKQRTQGHVLRSDIGWPEDTKLKTSVDQGKRVYDNRSFRIEYSQKEDGKPNGLYIDYIMC